MNRVRVSKINSMKLKADGIDFWNGKGETQAFIIGCHRLGKLTSGGLLSSLDPEADT